MTYRIESSVYGQEKAPRKGLSPDEMYQKVLQYVNPCTDVEVRMARDGSYKVLTIQKKIV